jgi:peptidoglycan/xylan/chitin deacetylase (PgdA/CDA1 family)
MLTDTLYRVIGSYLSPAGRSARLSILIYHRVLAEQDSIFPGEATVDTFNAQISRLKVVFNVLPLVEAIVRLKAGTLPARAACITFDDGYADNLTHALPILQKHGLHATFFIATAYLNGGRMFNDTIIEAIRNSHDSFLDFDELGLGCHDVSTAQAKCQAINKILHKVKYLPVKLREEKVAQLAHLAGNAQLVGDMMMTTAQLKAMHAAGMGIGAHTSRHPILVNLSDKEVCDEILTGQKFLEDTLGETVTLFAYPNGKPGIDYLSGQAAIVRELGFDAAVSTQTGYATNGCDLFQLPRFTPWQTNTDRFILSLLNNLR